jgi:hypothetical protein
MTDNELEKKVKEAIQRERKITAELLRLINLIEDRQIHLQRGFPSLFAWLVDGHGYSEGAAQRRIQAARLVRAVPDTTDKLESGALSLTNVAKAQAVIRTQERISKKKLTKAEKAEVLTQLEGAKTQEAEKTLVNLFPETGTKVYLERKTIVDEEHARISLTLPQETVEELDSARHLLAHVFPYGQYADIIGYIVKYFLKRRDPCRATKCRSG